MKRAKKNIRKPRASEIRVDFGRAQVLSGMHVSDDGTLTFFDERGNVVEPARIEVGSAYDRPKKTPKVLARLTAQPARIQLDPNRGLSRFDFVLAVDTNTVEIGTTRVSISVPVLVRDIEITAGRWNAKLVPQDAFEFHDATASPERIGWWEAIKRIDSSSEVRGSVAVIVDSDLDGLATLNARREEILEGFYLPDGHELLYGCGDRGTEEYIANAAIAHCDRVARRLLARARDQGCSGTYVAATGVPYVRFRYWAPPRGEAVPRV